MTERIGILEHHIDNCLALYLKDTAPKRVRKKVVNMIIPSLEEVDIEDISAYSFLKDPAKREKYMEALTDAGLAYVTGDFYVIPDWDSENHANFDVICKGCGNFDGVKCNIDTMLDTKTSSSPPDNTK